MGLLEAVIKSLITICLIVLAVWLIIWVLGMLGVTLPGMVVKILWIIVVLIAILVLFRILWPPLSGHIGW